MQTDIEKDDQTFMRQWGLDLLHTSGACGCGLAIFNQAWRNERGMEPSATIVEFWQTMEARNREALEERGRCLTSPEIAAAAARVFGLV